jgi:hypothetical protein
VRLVFVGSHRLRFVGRIVPAASQPLPIELPLVSATHSRLGDALGAVAAASAGATSLAPGDTLTLSFAASPPEKGLERDYVLVATGVYTAAAPETGRTPAEEPASRALPTRFALGQNQPNPFASTTRIHFDLPLASRVRLDVFDLQGRRVRVLADAEYPAGFHAVEWDRRGADGHPVPAGVYLYRLHAGAFLAHRKMVLLAR